jgi:hypothetical protein
MVLDSVADEQQPLSECWLYRCDDRSPFAYARGREFIRYGDHARWAQLRDDRLVSVRSGEILAYQVGGEFYDAISREPVYYQPPSAALAGGGNQPRLHSTK